MEFASKAEERRVKMTRELKAKRCCDACGTDAKLKLKRGMALCPECVEMAKDFFGR